VKKSKARKSLRSVIVGYRPLIGTSSAAVIGSPFAALVRAVGADVSDFVAVEASLRPFLSRFTAIATQMRIGAAVVTALRSERLLWFAAVSTQMTFRAAVVALPGIEATTASSAATAFLFGLFTFPRDVAALTAVVAALTASAATTASIAAERSVAEPAVAIVGAVGAVTRTPVGVVA